MLLGVTRLVPEFFVLEAPNSLRDIRSRPGDKLAGGEQTVEPHVEESTHLLPETIGLESHPAFVRNRSSPAQSSLQADTTGNWEGSGEAAGLRSQIMPNKRAAEEVTNADLAVMIRELTSKVDNSNKQMKLDRQYYRGKFVKIEKRLNTVECEVGKKTIIVDGIEEDAKPDESFTDLCQIIINIAAVLGVNIVEAEIDDIWRVGIDKKKIKVIFLRSIVKREIIKRMRARKKFSTLDIGGKVDKQIYLNEELGAGAAEIWKKARQLKKDKVIAKCFTSGGRVFFVEKEPDKPKLCTSVNQLLNIEGEGSVESESEPEIQPNPKKNRK